MADDRAPATSYAELPIVRNHIAAAADWIARAYEITFIEEMTGVLRHCDWLNLPFESPLEALFYVWWDATRQLGMPKGCELLQQHEVMLDGQRFRLDFVIRPEDQALAASGKWIPMAIEVDGHTFHERTAEQVMARDRRDRALQKAGWKVFHFSYSEFASRPDECICEVAWFAHRNISDVLSEQRQLSMATS